MTQRKADEGLDFEALRLGIERCNLERVLGFYAEDVELSVVNASAAPQGSPFELRGKAEIAKYLRAVFDPGTSHRIEQDVIGEEQVRFWEACEYPDGSRIVVETTLEVNDGKIIRQTDVVARDAQADREEEIGRSPPTRRTRPRARPGANAPPPDNLQRSEQATEKEDLRRCPVYRVW